MANWCYSSVTFYHKSKFMVSALRDEFEKVFKNPVDKDTTGGWLGDYIDHFIPKQKESLSYRGNINDIGPLESFSSGWCFSVNLECAWSPKVSILFKIVSECYPGVEIAYIAEEPGCDIFYCYDSTGSFYDSAVYIDYSSDDDCFSDCYSCEDDAIDFLVDYFNVDSDEFDKIRAAVSSHSTLENLVAYIVKRDGLYHHEDNPEADSYLSVQYYEEVHPEFAD